MSNYLSKTYFIFSYSYISNSTFENLKNDYLSSSYKVEKLNEISLYDIFGLNLSVLKNKIGNYIIIYPLNNDLGISSHYSRVHDLLKKYQDSDNLSFLGLCYNNILYTPTYLRAVFSNEVESNQQTVKLLNKNYIAIFLLFFLTQILLKKHSDIFYYNVRTISPLSYHSISHNLV